MHYEGVFTMHAIYAANL